MVKQTFGSWLQNRAGNGHPNNMARDQGNSQDSTPNARPSSANPRPHPSTGSHTTSTTKISLETLDRDFSISKYLSPSALRDSTLVITSNGTPLDATYLILLALNEECRQLRRGCFYHLPLRQDQTKGHPCDLAFVDEAWGEKSVTTWDSGNWEERLRMCDAERKLVPSEDAIPICCRITKAGVRPDTGASYSNHIYSSRSDPAIDRHGVIETWSRPLADQSRFILLYGHHHSLPTFVTASAAEAPSECTSFPTPGDLSETFIPHWQRTTVTVFGRRSACDSWPDHRGGFPAARLSNRRVVLALLYIWNKGYVDDLPGSQDEKAFGALIPWSSFDSSKLLWQEMRNIVYGQTPEEPQSMLAFWPSE